MKRNKKKRLLVIFAVIVLTLGLLSLPSVSDAVVDKIAPIIYLPKITSTPVISGIVSGNLKVTDNVRLKCVQVFLDGVALTPIMSTAPYYVQWNTKEALNGTHLITITAEDTAGNKTEKSVQVNVNNILPPIVLPTPTTTPTTTPPIYIPVPTSTPPVLPPIYTPPTEPPAPTSTPPVDLPTPTTTPPIELPIPTTTLPVATTTPPQLPPEPATTTPVLSSNLIVNASLESDSGALPNWHTGSWGTNDAAFTYPISGTNGNGAEVAISNYTDGDAKWYFDDVLVNAGDTYVFSDKYQSNVQTVAVARFIMDDATTAYLYLGAAPAGSDWQAFTADIAVPAHAISLTVFHLINSAGNLKVDEFSLVNRASVPITGAFDQGHVSLTFDDGWLSQYTNAMPILNQAGVKAGFYIITDEMKNAIGNNIIPGAAFDSALADNWHEGNWGTNDAQFISPIGRTDGGRGAGVVIKNYTDGDAKWYFDDVSIDPATTYTFTDRYLADVQTALVARFTMSDGSYQYLEIKNLPASSSWQTLNTVITPPAGALSLSVFHLLRSAGSLDVEGYSLVSNYYYVSAAQVREMQAAGHEIGAHSQTHPMLTTLTQEQMTNEIAGAKDDLMAIGVTPDVFVYPYGDYNNPVIQTVKDAGYDGARSVEFGFNTKETNKYALKTQEVNVNTTLQDVKTWVDSAMKNKTWLTLMFHQVDNEGLAYSTTPAVLQQIVDYLKQANASVITLGQGLGLLNQ